MLPNVKGFDVVNDNIPETVKLESVRCPLGCEERDESVLHGFDRLHDLPGKFSVVRCLICGLMRTNPRPTPETMGFYYPQEYGPYLDTKVRFCEDQGEERPLWKRIAHKLIQFNTNALPSLEPGEMLEIGCASGAFMHQMAGQGWKVAGVEYSPGSSQNARDLGYQVYTGALESAPAPDMLYDLVVGWMVLEHLHDPIYSLRKLHQWTKPGGWLVLSVPNAGSLEFRLLKDAWYALQLPTHLFHYTTDTVCKVLEEGGWQMKKIMHQRVLTNLLASIGYRVEDCCSESRIARALVRLIPKGMAVNATLYPVAYVLGVFGQTGRMTVWAQRAG